ncbi:MAG: hypothetical protein AB1522_15110 [Chloroflexota bacterium]
MPGGVSRSASATALRETAAPPAAACGDVNGSCHPERQREVSRTASATALREVAAQQPVKSRWGKMADEL